MCTAYTNLANTFLVSFPLKNSHHRRCLRLRPSELYIVCQDYIFPVSFNIFVNNDVQTERSERQHPCAG